MTSEPGLLFAWLCLSRKGTPTAWEVCATLLAATEAPDVVAVTPPGSHLDRGLRVALPNHALFMHVPAEIAAATVEGAASEGVRVALGDRDRDRRPAHTSRWPPVPAPPNLRLRRLDTLYADSHDVKLLLLDCPSSAPHVLRGAQRVLMNHCPAIVVDLTSVPVADRVAVWEACVAAAGAGYDWSDGMLLPCETPKRRMESVLGCANRVACAMPAGARTLHAPPPQAATTRRGSAGLAALAWADWQARVTADPMRETGLSLAFDPNLPSRNLHPAESDGCGGWWRWTGPDVRSGFAMPIPAPGRWTIRLDVMNPGVVERPDDLRVYAAGGCLAPSLFSEHAMRFGPFTLPLAQAASVAWVQIVTPPTRRASPDDPRRIGIGLTQCALEPA